MNVFKSASTASAESIENLDPETLQAYLESGQFAATTDGLGYTMQPQVVVPPEERR